MPSSVRVVVARHDAAQDADREGEGRGGAGANKGSVEPDEGGSGSSRWVWCHDPTAVVCGFRQSTISSVCIAISIHHN